MKVYTKSCQSHNMYDAISQSNAVYTSLSDLSICRSASTSLANASLCGGFSIELAAFAHTGVTSTSCRHFPEGLHLRVKGSG